jgi:ACS family tartrate transporter-like MFS transporter
MLTAGQQEQALADPDAVVRKLHWNVLSLFVAVVVCCYLDRTALSFAALQLCAQPWFTPATYGLGAGLFYTSYVALQIPSNLVLRRLSAPVWLGAIIAAWGVVAACCALISGPASFYALRVLLGAAEAGAFPG